MAYTPDGLYNFSDTGYTPDGDFTLGETGVVDPEGSFDVTLDDSVGAFDAQVPPQANFAVTLEDVTVSFSGAIAVEASFAVQIENSSGSLIGDIAQMGDIVTTADDVAVDFVGEIAQMGDLIVTTENVTVSFEGFIPMYGDIAVTMDDAVGSFVAHYADNQGIIQNIQLDDAVAGLIGNYDENVNRQLLTLTPEVALEQATTLEPHTTEMVFEQGIPQILKMESVGEDCFIMYDCTGMFAENGTPMDYTVEGVAEDATWLTDTTCMQFEQGTPMQDFITIVGEDGTWMTLSFNGVLQQMTKIRPDDFDVIYQDTWVQYDFIHPVMDEPLDPYRYTPDIYNADANFDGSRYPNSDDFEFNFGRPDALALEHKHGVFHISFNSNATQGTVSNEQSCIIAEDSKKPEAGKTPWVDYPRDPVDPTPPLTGETHTVPIQEVYTMQNTLLVTLDDDLTEISFSDISLSLDADSYTWQFSGNLLDPDDIDLVKQLPDGTAIKLHITINGYVWHVLVEKIAISRVFGSKSASVTGRGLTALLSKPYEQPVSVNFGTTQDVRNIYDTILPVGWNELGDLYWLLGDAPIGSPRFWTVDGGAYSYSNKTPIEALGEFAKNIGCMLVPSPDSQELYIKGRYPVLPWSFSGTNVDVAITDDAIIQLTEEPVSSWQANGVYVHGKEIGGVLAFARLNGTAGERLAPTSNNGLMTDGLALRNLSERILSGQYSQPKFKSITTFMDGTLVPFINVGTFIGMTVDSVETKGIVNAVSISVTMGETLEVSQTLTIGETTPNSWVSFTELLPKDPQLVATLASTDGTTSLMTLLDGGVINVRGTGNVGGKYWINSTEIVDDAPNQTQEGDIVL